jgi:hypothetical protein
MYLQRGYVYKMKIPILSIKLKRVNIAWRRHKRIPPQGALHNRYAGKRFSLHCNPAFKSLLKQTAKEDGVTVERLLDVILFLFFSQRYGISRKDIPDLDTAAQNQGNIPNS